MKRNPVGRLKAVMLELMVYPRQAHGIAKAWAGIFGCAPDNKRELMEGLIRIGRLNDEALYAVCINVKDCPDFFLSPFASIAQLTSHMGMETAMASVPGFPDSQLINSLNFVEHALDSSFQDGGGDKTPEIRALIESLDKLLVDCQSTPMNDDLKAVFVRQIHALRTALMTAEICGPDGIEDALNQALGSLYRNHKIVTEEQAAGDPRIARFWEILGKTNDLVASCQIIVPALAPISTFLLQISK
jgi:hypothetical protein